MKTRYVAAAIGMLFLHALESMAATLPRPSPSEWASWPEYCRAKYTYLRAEDAREFSPTVSQSLVEQHRAALGPAWPLIHHYCSGLFYLQRATLARTPQERQFALRSSRNETLFTFTRLPTQMPLYAEVATHLGTVARTGGDSSTALDYFRIAMQTHPEYPGGYQGTALVLQDQGKVDEAIDVLLKANSVTEGESAEIHYFLGMAYLKQKNFDKASEHARLAYNLGYPLPGLRNKLAAAGRSIN